VNYANSAIGAQAPREMPSRLTQVQEQVERSAKITAMLEQLSGDLYKRLGLVLRDIPPAPTAQPGKEPKPLLVGHASSLANHNDQIESVASALADILERLEL
jgi:hypothetical protein